MEFTEVNGTYDLAPYGLGDIRVRLNIPEPNTLSLLGLGMTALLILRRRQ